MELKDYLKSIPSYSPIKLIDNEGRILYDGFCWEIEKNQWFINWEVIGHSFCDSDILIWIQ